MIRRIVALAGLLAAGTAHAQSPDNIDGFALLFGTPLASPHAGRYAHVPPSPQLKREWFERELKAINDRGIGFDFTRGAVVKLSEWTAGAIASQYIGPKAAPTISAAAGKLIDYLIADRGDILRTDRLALLDLATAAKLAGAAITANDLRNVALSKAALDAVSAKDRDEYKRTVEELVKHWSDAEVAALRKEIDLGDDVVARARGDIAANGGAAKTIAKSAAVVHIDPSVATTQLAKLRQAQKDFLSATTDKAKASALSQIVDQSRTLSDLGRLAQGAFQLAGAGKAAEIAGKATLAFATIANVASNLPHNPLGAAVALIGGLGGLFGSGRDAWKDEVSGQLQAIQRELAEQRKLLGELIQSVRLVAAGQLTNAELITTEARLSDRWSKRIALDIGALDERQVLQALRPYRECLLWATESAAASVAFHDGMTHCAQALALLQAQAASGAGRFETWSDQLIVNSGFSAGAAATPGAVSPFQHAAELLGTRAVYREMAAACGRSASCIAAVAQALPEPVRKAYPGDQFMSAPLLDPRYVQVVADAADQWFDFYAACRDPAASTKALVEFVAMPPYKVVHFPTDLVARCKQFDYAWKAGVLPQLEVAAQLVRIARVQLAILGGEYLVPEVIGQLATPIGARTDYCTLSTPAVACDPINPKDEIARAVQACKTDCKTHGGVDCETYCETYASYLNEAALGDAEKGKLQAVIELEATRLCSTAAGGTSMACLIDLNPLFAANLGLAWAERRVIGADPAAAARRGHVYGIAYYDSVSCAGLSDFAAPGGVLEGRRHEVYRAVDRWSAAGRDNGDLQITNNGKLACVLAAPAVELSAPPAWSARIYEVHAAQCRRAAIPLPDPQAVRLSLPAFETKVARDLAAVEETLGERASVIDPPRGADPERFDADRWRTYGRLRLIREATLRSVEH